MKIAKGKIAVFAGTTEGRLLASCAAGSRVQADVFVATEYGKAEIPKAENIHVHDGRIDEIQMEELFREKKYDLILGRDTPVCGGGHGEYQGGGGEDWDAASQNPEGSE